MAKLTKEKRNQLAKEELGTQLEEEMGTINEKEEKKIYQLLKNPKLLDIIVEEIQDKKVVGEKETVETVFIIANSKNVKNIKPTSSNLLVNDLSGLGKDFITKATLDIFPKHEVVSRTKITPELFTYWHNPKFEPDWTWDGKVFYLEDVPNKIINSDVFKVFSSGGSKATVLVNQTPFDIEIRGKPSMIVTSAEANPSSENLRRFPICFLDHSEKQTLNIMIRQSEIDETCESIDYNPIITMALNRLYRVNVIIPFAKKLPHHFPKNRFMRTHYKRFLDIIKSITCLYQFQREKLDGNIIATGEDYDIAKRILLKTTSNPSMIPLTRQKKDILQLFEENENKWFALSEIEDKFPVSDRWLRKQVKELFRDSFLLSNSEFRDGVKKPVPIYCYNQINKIEIPNWCSINTTDSFNSFNSVNSVNNKTVNTSLGEDKEKDKRNKRNKRNRKLAEQNPLNKKILELKKYCEKIKTDGHKITYENLVYNFDKSLVEICKNKKILLKLPDGNFDFGG